MSIDARLDAVPLVEIDEGVFKYVLIKVYGKESPNGEEAQKSIVRYEVNYTINQFEHSIVP